MLLKGFFQKGIYEKINKLANHRCVDYDRYFGGLRAEENEKKTGNRANFIEKIKSQYLPLTKHFFHSH